jgi:quinoprotein glucose dehydrogenase
MRSLYLFIVGFFLSTSLCHAKNELIQDFEGDGFDSWQSTGTAFGLSPVAGKMDGLDGELRGYSGDALVCSANGGYGATGSLTSPEFTVTHPYIAFLVGGGSTINTLAVQLLVDNKVVRVATGHNGLTLRTVVWNVAEFKNKKAIIRIVDNEKGDWGFIAADRFVFSAVENPVLPNNGRPKAKLDGNLIPVPNEASAAILPGLKMSVVASHEGTGVSSPTSISIASDGRLFVAETHRYHRGIEDDRGNLYWYHDDLANSTVEDRRKMLEKWSSKKPADWYTQESEIVRMLSGTKADGSFAQSSVYADGFNKMLDGTGSGILVYGDTVYFECIPNIWILKDSPTESKPQEKKVLQDGFGVRVSLSGHDLSGSVVGYDGRIWGSVGDRGFNLTTREGKKYNFKNKGAVFRFDPDGSNFEVVHTGLRNPKEIAFDEWGNFIAVDNNSDQGDEARIVYVVEGADSGWEMEHQAMHTFHREIGIDVRPPSRWMTERMWELQNSQQPAYIIPPSGYICAGPSGLTYSPGVGFLDSEKGFFHVCDYRGSTPASGVWSFRLEPQGAGMKLAESHQLIWGIAATDVDYDWKGRVLVSDFIGGYESHQDGRIIALEASQPKNSAAVTDVEKTINSDFGKKSSAELAQLLAHADKRVRLFAQLELSRRTDALDLFTTATQSSNPIERLHGVWGLGIIARRGSAMSPSQNWKKSEQPTNIPELRNDASKVLISLLSHTDLEVRANAIRALSEAPVVGNDLPLAKLILDPSPKVRAFTSIAAGRLGADKFLPEVSQMIKENADKDTVLRHAGVMAIDGMCKSPAALQALGKNENSSIRLAVVITQRRRADANVVEFIQDKSPVVADEAIRAIYDMSLEQDRPAVAALLDNLHERKWTSFMLRRLVHNAYRVGGVENAKRLTGVALDKKIPNEVRVEALRLISMWTNPYPVDQLTGHWAPLAKRSNEEVVDVLNIALPGLLECDSDIIKISLDLVSLYQLKTELLSNDSLKRILGDLTLSGPTRAKALEMLLTREPADSIEIITRYTHDIKDEVAVMALSALARRDAEVGFAAIKTVLKNGSILQRQGAWKILGQLQAKGVDDLFIENLKLLQASEGVSPSALELLEAAAQRKDAGVKVALVDFENFQNQSKEKLTRWLPALEGGNAINGFALYQALPVAQCMRCHKATTKLSQGAHIVEGEAGPNLAGVAKRGDRRYLLESIVFSNAKVVSGYGITSLELINGVNLVGTLIQEKPEYVDVNSSGNLWRINRKDIKTMTPPVSGMPPFDALLKPTEVRDLVAWLATLDSSPPMPKPKEPKVLDISTLKPAAK